jgi:hypothetical protein
VSQLCFFAHAPEEIRDPGSAQQPHWLSGLASPASAPASVPAASEAVQMVSVSGPAGLQHQQHMQQQAALHSVATASLGSTRPTDNFYIPSVSATSGSRAVYSGLEAQQPCAWYLSAAPWRPGSPSSAVSLLEALLCKSEGIPQASTPASTLAEQPQHAAAPAAASRAGLMAGALHLGAGLCCLEPLPGGWGTALGEGLDLRVPEVCSAGLSSLASVQQLSFAHNGGGPMLLPPAYQLFAEPARQCTSPAVADSCALGVTGIITSIR